MPAARTTLALVLACCLGLIPARGDTEEQAVDDFADDHAVADGDEPLGDALDLDDIEAPPPCGSPDSPAEVLLDCFVRGDRGDRLTAATWIFSALEGQADHTRPPAEIDRDIAGTLIALMRDEPDDWISRELIQSVRYGNPGLSRSVFISAIDEPSINLKAAAVDYATYHEVPEMREALEDLWRRSVPAWLRPGLIEALAEQGITDYAGDFIRLARADDALTRLAAIAALGTLRLPEAEPVLLRASRSGPTRERTAALRALGKLPASNEVLDTLLAALAGDEAGIRAAAITALGHVDDPRASFALIGILEHSSEWIDLKLASTALEDSGDPGATSAISGVLTRADLDWKDVPSDEILLTLYNRDDAAALPDLRNAAAQHGKEFEDEAAKTIDYLSRTRVPGDSSRMFMSSCSFGSSPDPTDPRVRRTSPAPPFDSSRCWDSPGHFDGPEPRPRITQGSLVEIVDYFERPDGTWAETLAAGSYCWLPVSELVPADTLPSEAEPSRRPRFEFDLLVAEMGSPIAHALVEAGMLDFLESDDGSGVVAAALSVDPADPDQVALLEAGSPGRRGVLDRALDRLRHACCGPLP